MILSGDIGFVITNKNILSEIIAWFMGSKWSHSFVVVYDLRTVETNNTVVYLNTLDDHVYNKDKNLEIWSPNCSNEQRKQIVEASLRMVGIKYGYLKLLAMGFRRILMKIGIKTPLLWTRGTVCDDVAIAGLNSAGILSVKNIDTEELYQLVKKSGFKMVFDQNDDTL